MFDIINVNQNQMTIWCAAARFRINHSDLETASSSWFDLQLWPRKQLIDWLIWECIDAENRCVPSVQVDLSIARELATLLINYVQSHPMCYGPSLRNVFEPVFVGDCVLFACYLALFCCYCLHLFILMLFHLNDCWTEKHLYPTGFRFFVHWRCFMQFNYCVRKN